MDFKNKTYEELKDILKELKKEIESREDAVIIFFRLHQEEMVELILDTFNNNIDIKSVHSYYCDRLLEREINGKNPVYLFDIDILRIWEKGKCSYTTFEEWSRKLYR